MKLSGLVQLVAVLIHEAVGSIGKLLNGLITPPRTQVSGLVKLPTLVVQAVGELVAHRGANVAVVDGKRKVGVVEGRFQLAGRDCCKNSEKKLNSQKISGLKNLLMEFCSGS